MVAGANHTPPGGCELFCLGDPGMVVTGFGFAVLGLGLLGGAIGSSVYLARRTEVEFDCPSCQPRRVQFPIEGEAVELWTPDFDVGEGAKKPGP